MLIQYVPAILIASASPRENRMHEVGLHIYKIKMQPRNPERDHIHNTGSILRFSTIYELYQFMILSKTFL